MFKQKSIIVVITDEYTSILITLLRLIFSYTCILTHDLILTGTKSFKEVNFKD